MKKIIISLLLLVSYSVFPQKSKNITSKPIEINEKKIWFPKNYSNNEIIFNTISFKLMSPKWVESEDWVFHQKPQNEATTAPIGPNTHRNSRVLRGDQESFYEMKIREQEYISQIGCGNRQHLQIEQSIVSIVSGVRLCKDSTKLFQIIWMDSPQYFTTALSKSPQIPNFHFLYIKIDSVYFDEGTSNEIYSKINSLSESDKKEFKLRAFQELKSKIEVFYNHNKELEKIKSITKLNKFIEKTSNIGLIIMNWKLYEESGYTTGKGIDVEVFNPTKKTIKYIWFYVKGENPVGDPVKGRNGKYVTQLTSIGPIKPNGQATYEFDYVWFTDLVHNAKITSIKIQYMDKSIKIIKNPKLVTLPQDLLEFTKNYSN